MLSNNLRGNENVAPVISLLDGKNNKDLVRNIIVETNAYLTKLIPALRDISTGLRSGEVAKATGLFTSAIEGLDWLAQLIAILKERYGARFTNLSCNNMKVDALEEDMLNILTEIIPAQVNKNWTLMADLLEHELVHNLNLWATVLPNVIQLEQD
jgi:hypothetical protein